MAASWKGTINFGLVAIPVELQRVEQSVETESTMLDSRDMSPVGYKRYNKKTGDEVEWKDIVSGYEYEDGQYVVLTDEERKEAHPKSTQEIDILEFVETAEIDTEYYERPYFIKPRSKSTKAYVALRETLERTGKTAIAQVVLHTRQHLAAITVRGPALILNLLRYTHEMRSVDDLDLPGEKGADTKLSPAEIKMAEELVASMSGEWSPEKYRDTYRDKLMELIETKAATGSIVALEESTETGAKGKVLDLMAALKESMSQQEKKPVKTAKTAKRPATQRRRKQRQSA